MRSDKLNATRCDSVNLTRQAVVNEFHRVNPVQLFRTYPGETTATTVSQGRRGRQDRQGGRKTEGPGDRGQGAEGEKVKHWRRPEGERIRGQGGKKDEIHCCGGYC